jgi:hypothetical protein
VPTLADLLPPIGSDPFEVVDAFANWDDGTGRALYAHQQEAILALADGDHTVVATPTGSGKSLIAIAGMALARNRGERSVWTAPIKALVGEKFFDLVDIFGAHEVGLATGDASINTDAAMLVCTAEVLANSALRRGDDDGFSFACLDEFHFYGDRERGWAWQVPLLMMRNCQFLLPSATLGDMSAITDDLRQRTGRPVSEVTTVHRPTPLHHQWRMTPVLESIADALRDATWPVYLVHPSQAAAVERAQSLSSAALTSRDQREKIAEALHGVRFAKGFGLTLARLLKLGVGVHHAGMLPRYRRLVEQLASQGLLPVVCGTDTLGVGVNLPIRTVLLTQLTKFDGSRVRTLTPREFHQLAGRAGRPGFDPDGHVWAQAPEHVIENERLLSKAGDDPKARRKVKRVEAPKDFVRFDEATFDRLIVSSPEPLRSRFRITPDLVASVLARGQQAGPLALKELIASNHDGPTQRRAHTRRAISIYRALEAAGVACRIRDEAGRCTGVEVGSIDGGAALRFASPLVPFAIELIGTFDRDDPSYTLDVISVIEAIADDPMALLLAQQYQARDIEWNRLKADGVPHDERGDLLAKITWPKPLQELIEATFAAYRMTHRWLDTAPSPKSIVREMAETGETFGGCVRRYRIERSEGLLLRYLSDVWRLLDRSLPDELITEEIEDIIDWLAGMIRATDASLLDEWTVLAGGQVEAAPEPEAPTVGGVPRAWRTAVRTAVFSWVELLARQAHEVLAARSQGTTGELNRAMAPYWAQYSSIGIDQAARAASLFVIDDSVRDIWTVRQRLSDPDGDHEWELVATVDLVEAAESGAPTLVLQSVGRLDELGETATEADGVVVE